MEKQYRYSADAKWLERRRGEIRGDADAPV